MTMAGHGGMQLDGHGPLTSFHFSHLQAWFCLLFVAVPQAMQSYLGWEQEFFVMPADLYKARPDLVNCGRTLFGKLPTRHQQGDLNYFQPIPGSVQDGPSLVDGC